MKCKDADLSEQSKSFDKNGLVSIIVPCYNSELYLHETLSNICKQSYQYWECIIIDDGSTDATSAICNSFLNCDKRFRLFTQTNRGLSASRNLGLEKSTGQYVQFLDSDDFLHSKKLEVQITLLNENPQTDIVYGPCKFFSSEQPEVFYDRYNRKKGHWMKEISNDKNFNSFVYLITSNVMPVNAALYRISSNRKFKFFDESLRSLEDWDYWLSLLFEGAMFQYKDDPSTISYIRVHTRSMTKNSSQMALANVLIRQRLHVKLLELKSFSKLNTKKLVSLNKYLLGRTMVRNSTVKPGLVLILRNAYTAPGGILNFLKSIPDLFYRARTSLGL